MEGAPPATDGSSAAPLRRAVAPLLFSLVLVLLTAWWLIFNKHTLGHDDWGLVVAEHPLPLQSLAMAFLSLLLFGGLIGFFAYDRFKRAKTRKDQNGATAWCIAAIALFALVWAWTLNSPLGALPQVENNWSDVSNQYFSTAYEIDDARAFTAEYAGKHQHFESRLQAHVATHPPGAVLFYYGARRIYEAVPLLQDVFNMLAERLSNDTVSSLALQANNMRAASARSAGLEPPPSMPLEAVGAALWCNFLLTLALALTVPAVYVIAAVGPNENGQAEARGLVAALLFALAPSIAIFAFTLDMLIACGAAWSFAFAMRYWERGQAKWLILAGIILALTSFLSFGALATGVIVALGTALWSFSRRGDGSFVQKLARSLLLYGAGFALAWLALIVLFPMQPLPVFLNAMAEHKRATLGGIRDARYWVWLNLVFYLCFIGWPVAVGMLRQLAVLARGKSADLASPASLRTLGLATVAAMLALTLSGRVLGEVERLWLFLAPPCLALAAAWWVREPPNKKAACAWISLIVLQTLQTLLLATRLEPLVSPI